MEVGPVEVGPVEARSVAIHYHRQTGSSAGDATRLCLLMVLPPRPQVSSAVDGSCGRGPKSGQM